VREDFLAFLSRAEEEELSEEERQELESVDGPGLIPISGIWLHALPLPDQFILELLQAISNDYETGGSKRPKRRAA
jgi:hypothetical protein